MATKGELQVGSRVELPPRSSYREADPDVGFEGDTHGEVVKIKNDAAWVRMDSDRMDWFPIADLKLVPPGRSHAARSGARHRAQKTWHIFETGRATGDRWVAGPYMTKSRAEELARRYMTDPPGPDSLRRSGVYIVKDHGP